MKKIISTIALGAALLAGAAALTPAAARVSIGIGIGGPGYYGGYSGGPSYNYCDRYSRWYDPYRCGYYAPSYYDYGYYGRPYYGPSFYVGGNFGGHSVYRGGGSYRGSGGSFNDGGRSGSGSGGSHNGGGTRGGGHR